MNARNAVVMLIIFVLTPGFLGCHSRTGETRVHVGDYRITDQKSLSSLSGYTTITGDLFVTDTKLTNLDPLRTLSKVGGLYLFTNESLTNIDGLSAITSIGRDESYGEFFGDLHIRGNSNLDNLGGLKSLKSISGSLVIDSSSFSDFDELSNLSSVGGRLDLRNNYQLQNIRGLASLKSVSWINVYYNPNLPNCEIETFMKRLRSGGWSEKALVGGNDSTTKCLN